MLGGGLETRAIERVLVRACPGRGFAPMSHRVRYIVTLGAASLVLLMFVGSTMSRTTVDEFSPHSLKFRSRSRLTWMGIPVLSLPCQSWDDEVLTLLADEGFVSRQPGGRWEPMFSLTSDPRIRQQSRRRNPYYMLFVENKSSTLAWSRNHRKCSKLYWMEAITLLRSSDKGENAAGRFILWECQDIVDLEKMRAKIDEFKEAFRDYPG
jgi:hypothetical protein